MRIPCQSPILIRGRLLGGPRPLICLPLVAAAPEDLPDQARRSAAMAPDLVEWRVDAMTPLPEPQTLAPMLESLRRDIGDLPLLFTCRRRAEGGRHPVPAPARLALDLAAVACGQVDLVDVELAGPQEMVTAVAAACHRHGVKLILSGHDFSATPDRDAIVARLAEARARGADVAKAAVMARDPQDLLVLLEAGLEARRRLPSTPLIPIAMGPAGELSRIIGGLFGADLTFAAGPEASAPGQIPIGRLRAAWQALGLFADPRRG
jgi:3-dehydroquinate dehydratase-1